MIAFLISDSANSKSDQDDGEQSSRAESSIRRRQETKVDPPECKLYLESVLRNVFFYGASLKNRSSCYFFAAAS